MILIRKYMKNNISQNGFTIIEILISVAILSIVFTALVTILMQQQRQFNLTSQGVDVDQTGRTALDYIATELRNVGARQGKNVAIQFINGGSEFDPLCSDTTTKTDQDSPPDCITLFTWDITDGQVLDTTTSKTLTIFPSTAEGIDATLISSALSINVGNWLTPTTDSDLIESGDVIGFWSRGSLCNEVNANTCLSNPGDCTECGAVLKIDSLNTSTKIATVSNASSILSQNFQLSDFSDISTFYNNFFLPKISSLSSEMTIVQAKTFAVRGDKALVMDENGSGSFQAIAGGEISGDQVGAGIVDLQFVFNLQDSDGGITRVGMPFDDDDAVRQFADFTTVSSDMSLSYNGDMRGRERDTRTVEIYLVVRSRLKPQLISGSRIPPQDLGAIGDVAGRSTSHSSLGEGFIYKIFNTVVYLRNLSREELG
jgi:prepilin-type N-terminal cleavage/methylation domain-containing protein